MKIRTIKELTGVKSKRYVSIIRTGECEYKITYSRKDIMKSAWRRVRNLGISISEALKGAWKSAKENAAATLASLDSIREDVMHGIFTAREMAALTDAGFSRWQNGGMDRLYIDATRIGLDCDYYKSGSIRGALFNGEGISNRRAGEIASAKTFIDVKTGEVHSTDSDLLGSAVAFVKSLGIEVVAA